MTKNNNLTVKKERMFKFTFNIPLFKILGYIALVIILWYVFIEKEYIHIYLTEVIDKDVSLFYSILVSLTFLMYLVSTGIKITYGKKLLICLILFIGLLLYLGYQDFGLGIEFRENFHLLAHNRYESNSMEGLKFFYRNIPFWLIVYLICIALTGDDN